MRREWVCKLSSSIWDCCYPLSFKLQAIFRKVLPALFWIRNFKGCQRGWAWNPMRPLSRLWISITSSVVCSQVSVTSSHWGMIKMQAMPALSLRHFHQHDEVSRCPLWKLPLARFELQTALRHWRSYLPGCVDLQLTAIFKMHSFPCIFIRRDVCP